MIGNKFNALVPVAIVTLTSILLLLPCSVAYPQCWITGNCSAISVPCRDCSYPGPLGCGTTQLGIQASTGKAPVSASTGGSGWTFGGEEVNCYRTYICITTTATCAVDPDYSGASRF